MKRGIGLALALIAGCSEHGSTPAPDAPPEPGPIAYRLAIGDAEPADRERPASLPVVFIDGVARTEINEIYARAEDTTHVVHLVELRAADVVLRSRMVGIDSSCLSEAPPTEGLTQVLEGMCSYWSGDLRFGGASAMSDTFSCVADGFCAADCGGIFTCPGSSERCSSRTTSTMPQAAHMACVPIGPKQRGEACALIADAEGAYDDCGKDLLCVGGTCKAVCTCNNTSTCAGAFIPGQPPELRLCPGQ